jgi:hypothetical protein
MEKTSKFVTYTFYCQLLLIAASIAILLGSGNGIDKLDVLRTGIPAIILAPIILITGLVVLIKKHKASLAIWSSVCINCAAGMFFLFLVFFGKSYNF